MKQIPIGIVCQSATQFIELKRIASKLISNGGYQVFFVAHGDLDPEQVESVSLFCKAQNVNLIDWTKNPFYSATGLCNRIVSILRKRKASAWAVNLISQTTRYRWLLNDKHIQCLIVGEDGVGGPSRLISMAKTKKVKTLILPYEYSSRKQIIESLIPSNVRIQKPSLLKAAVCFLFPNWCLEFEGRKLLRLPPVEILLRELTGDSIENPWTVHGGAGHLILAESLKMKNHYLSEGVSESKVTVTGSLTSDEIHRMTRSEIVNNKSYNHRPVGEPRRLKVLCAFPPSYISERGHLCEYNSYTALVLDWIGLIESSLKADVTYQAHPNLARIDRNTLEKNIELNSSDIMELISGSDLLVTSVSSIIKTAIQFGKPVVNYDVYKFNYPDYEGTEGVFHVTSRAEFEAVLRDFDNPKFREDSTRRIIQSAAKWGVVDGKSWDRILEIIEITTTSSE